MTSTFWSDAIIKKVLLFDANTGAQEKHFEALGDKVYNVSFSPDGSQVLADSSNGTVQLWFVETGVEFRRLKVGGGKVVSVFSPDGARILTGSTNSLARLWDIETGAELRRFAGHREWVKGVAFSSDGKHILTGSQDKTMRLWDAHLPEGESLLRMACNSLPMRNGSRDLSMAGLTREIGLDDMPDLTPCEHYFPPMPSQN